MKLKVKKINYVAILETIFLILPSIKPYVVRISVFDNLYDIWGLVTLLLNFSLCFYVNKKFIKECDTIKYLFLFIGVYFVSTLINGLSSVAAVLSESSRLLICPLYLSYNYNKGQSAFKSAVHNIGSLYRIILYIDCVSILINLKYSIFISDIFSFLGMDNTAAFIVIPMLAVVIFDDLYQKGKISLNSIFLLWLCTLCKVLTYSLTACLALLVFIIMLLFTIPHKIEISCRKKLIKNFLNPRLIMVIMILILMGIVFFNVQYLFKSIIIALGKDVNLGRVRIWQNTVNTFFKSPIIGFGKVNPETFIELIGMSVWDQTCNHPHNSFLAIFFNCGIIGGFFFFKMLQKPLNKIIMYRNKREVIVLGIGMVSYIILMMADDYMFLPYIYVLVTILSLYNFKFDKVIFKIKKRKKIKFI